MDQQKNTILAVVLSGIVLIGWQIFFGFPQMEKQKQAAQQQAPQTQQQPQTQQPTQQPPAQQQQQPVNPNTPPDEPPTPAGQAPAPAVTRAAALGEASTRVRIETPRLAGSISLKGGRIDDLALVQYHEKVDPNSPAIVLLSPAGSPAPFYAEFGWRPAAGTTVTVPDDNTLWTQEGSGALALGHPVTLLYSNGQGLEIRRTIAVDDKYLFTVDDQVTNKTAASVSLRPFGSLARIGTPPTSGYAVRHEGPIGALGDKCLRQASFSISTECHEESYKTLEEKQALTFSVTNAWLGFTDTYWAATLLPDPAAHVEARFLAGTLGTTTKWYQGDYRGDPQTIPAGGTATTTTHLFAGAREVAVVDQYDAQLHLNHFDQLIDWGRLYLITKPMFWSIDWLYKLVGNFGIAILLITVIIKALFFPLANKSYASMAKMKAVQPEMASIRERYADDKVRQQQAMMELYKKEKINPVAGCLPILIQVPVFYSLYKVLFVTIEMRHAPFFGWIKDLSAPDPTNVFTLFGLVPWDPTLLPVVGPFLHLGIWPLIMGVTMWAQMKLNPAPPDPTQKLMFDWMPVVFTLMLSSFPAGLVIYWAWNNTLSVTQQSIIMHRHGAKIELWDNVKSLFIRKKKA